MTDPSPPRPRPLPTRRGRARASAATAALLAAAGVVVLLGAGCSSSPEFDREAAVNRLIDGSGGVIERGEAECYVDRVTAEVGTGPLAAGAEPQPEQIRELTSIKIDCVGLDKVGASTSLSTVPPTSVDGVIPKPQAYGDDPALDALWDQCEAGSGVACDQLFELAPLGSAYEEFAGTCGRRTQELVCAAVYTTPGAPAAPTTSPPGASAGS